MGALLFGPEELADSGEPRASVLRTFIERLDDFPFTDELSRHTTGGSAGLHEQASAVASTLEDRIAGGKVLDAAFGPEAIAALDQTKGVHIVACGTSCRHQIEHLSSAKPRHIVEVLADSLTPPE